MTLHFQPSSAPGLGMERTRTQAWLVADDLGYESEGDEVTTSSDVVVASSSSRLPRKHSEASHRATATTKERGTIQPASLM